MLRHDRHLIRPGQIIPSDHWDSLIEYISLDDLPTDDVQTVHRPAWRRIVQQTQGVRPCV